MRQLCNFVCAVQAESMIEEGAYEKWEAEINRPPAGYLRSQSYRPRSQVSPELDSLMRPGVGF